MCEIDDGERCEVWSETERRARKEHVCGGCDGTIARGATYTVHFSVFEGIASSAKICAACVEIRETFAAAHGNTYPHPESLTETLYECISEDEESEGRWQPMLDQMHARRAEREARR